MPPLGSHGGATELIYDRRQPPLRTSAEHSYTETLLVRNLAVFSCCATLSEQYAQYNLRCDVVD
jgi:phage portal protein BeeE